MKPTFRKLEVKDIGDLEKLVAENVEGIESGLKVIDSRLLLGQAAIDLVALDAQGALVLIALDFTADEGLLLRVMDAYSWCLEYPETIRRLYPTAKVSAQRPPRILFIVERLTDAFLRRVKALSFLQIDCLEFRHLEVNGAPAVYFDLVERLRRSGTTAVASEETSQMIDTRALRAPSEPPVARPEPLVVQPAPPVAAPEVPPSTAPARDATTVARQVAASDQDAWEAFLGQLEPSVTASAAPAPVAAPEAEPSVLDLLGLEEPVEAAPVQAAEPATGSKSSRTYLFGGVTKLTEPETAPSGPPPIDSAPVVAPAPEVTEPLAVEVEPQPVAPAAPAAPVLIEELAPAAAQGDPMQAAQAEAPPVDMPVAAPPTTADQPADGTAEKDGVGLVASTRPELGSIRFPREGLSRQWLEFLNQLSASK